MTLTICENTNLFTIQTDAYAHGCNMKGLMGHGIAVQFRQKYPQMYKAYKEHCDALKVPLAPGGMFFWPADHNNPAVYNLFTQIRPGKDGRLDACKSAFNVMFNHANANDIKTIAMPAIGCGIAGLRWKDVKFILQECMKDSDFQGEVLVAFILKEFDDKPERPIRAL